MSVPSIPSRMTAIGIAEPGGPGVLVPIERDVPEPAPGEVLVAVEAAGVNRPRRDAAPGPLSAASRGVGHSGAGDRGHRGRARRWGRRTGDRLPCVCARHRRRIRRVLRRARAALPARPRRTRPGRGRGGPGDVLHGVDQRLRPRPPRRGRVAARARGIERHRHHRDPARQGVRRDRPRHRRVEVEVRRLPRARSRRGDQLPRRGLRGSHRRADRRTRGRHGARHGCRRLPRAEPEMPRRRGPARDHRGAARAEGRAAQRAAHHAPAPDRDRLHAPPPLRRAEGGHRARAPREGCGRCSRRARCGRSCTHGSRSPTRPEPIG